MLNNIPFESIKRIVHHKNPKAFLFLAILPPQEIQKDITAIKHEFAKQYQSRHALKSPPHITLFPPFRWPQAQINQFQSLQEFCNVIPSIPIQVDGFGAFPPRVIYAAPIKSERLQHIHTHLQQFLESNLGLVDPMAQKREFTPHITVANRDLGEQFKSAWVEFQPRSLQLSFLVTHLSLLEHTGKCWKIIEEWPFRG